MSIVDLIDKVRVSPEMDGFAAEVYQAYVALMAKGFSEEQALKVVCCIVEAAWADR